MPKKHYTVTRKRKTTNRAKVNPTKPMPSDSYFVDLNGFEVSNGKYVGLPETKDKPSLFKKIINFIKESFK